MGMFGIAEILRNLDHTETRDVVRAGDRAAPARARRISSSRRCRSCAAPRSARILGILPGNGAVLGPFASYTIEKKLAKDPRRFGRGAIEGVAGPEAANNAGAQTSFIPLLTLGIPPNAVMALMVGAMTIHGIVPGPQVMTKNPNLFWGMIASMWIGNLMLLIINLPLIGAVGAAPQGAVSADVPGHPDVLLHRHLLDQQPADGRHVHRRLRRRRLALIKFGFEPAPLLLGFVLGKLMEENLRRALIISRGDTDDLPRSADQRRACSLVAVRPARSSPSCPRSGRAATRSSSSSAP